MKTSVLSTFCQSSDVRMSPRQLTSVQHHGTHDFMRKTPFNWRLMFEMIIRFLWVPIVKDQVHFSFCVEFLWPFSSNDNKPIVWSAEVFQRWYNYSYFTASVKDFSLSDEENVIYFFSWTTSDWITLAFWIVYKDIYDRFSFPLWWSWVVSPLQIVSYSGNRFILHYLD